MLGNLGVHIHRYPTGRYGFVGTIPFALCNEYDATKSEIIGGQSFRNADGKLMIRKAPTFLTLKEARDHARNRGVATCQSKTCACYALK